MKGIDLRQPLEGRITENIGRSPSVCSPRVNPLARSKLCMLGAFLQTISGCFDWV